MTCQHRTGKELTICNSVKLKRRTRAISALVSVESCLDMYGRGPLSLDGLTRFHFKHPKADIIDVRFRLTKYGMAVDVEHRDGLYEVACTSIVGPMAPGRHGPSSVDSLIQTIKFWRNCVDRKARKSDATSAKLADDTALEALSAAASLSGIEWDEAEAWTDGACRSINVVIHNPGDRMTRSWHARLPSTRSVEIPPPLLAALLPSFEHIRVTASGGRRRYLLITIGSPRLKTIYNPDPVNLLREMALATSKGWELQHIREDVPF